MISCVRTWSNFPNHKGGLHVFTINNDFLRTWSNFPNHKGGLHVFMVIVVVVMFWMVVSFAETLEAEFARFRDKCIDAQYAPGGVRMYVTMDSYENDWEVVKRGWDAFVLGEAPQKFKSAIEAIKTIRQAPGANDQYLTHLLLSYLSAT
ncbi:phosphoglycerate mutase, 2,3-bisphosphoglycerate-independent [Artemisia annua]|uniref:phosphoglycerate mutase (2,3-diphosphoglycerate-independent) n=1 Tax=Artemisia annua TaxID=35608 RepID=A0A2U1LT87_ARTAN|nr:phosphoglycerate mutase, 2,3-bisphosphoglycerate-independent [Artemisia annua]